MVSECFSRLIDSIRAMMIVWRLGGKIISSVLYYIVYYSCAQWTVLKFAYWFRFRFCFCAWLFKFNLYRVFALALDHLIPVLLASVALDLVSSVPSQEIGWEECFRNDLFGFEWDVKNLDEINQLRRWIILLMQATAILWTQLIYIYVFVMSSQEAIYSLCLTTFECIKQRIFVM